MPGGGMMSLVAYGAQDVYLIGYQNFTNSSDDNLKFKSTNKQIKWDKQNKKIDINKNVCPISYDTIELNDDL